jgi:hypothetical protein
MSVPINERRLGEPRVKFERPLDVRAMAIDGTWCRKCLLIDVSETGARIKLTSPAAGLTEFFLLLTTFGIPVFRRCSRQWVDGLLMGVMFEQGPIEEKPLSKLRRDAELV